MHAPHFYYKKPQRPPPPPPAAAAAAAPPSTMSLFLSAPPLRNSPLFNPLPTPKRAVSCSTNNATCFRGVAAGGANKLGSLRLSTCSSPGLVYRRCGDLFLRNEERKAAKGGRGGGAVCSASVFNPHTLHWISAVSSVILMFAKGTAIQKAFLVPLFVLLAPINVFSWIKGEYGTWAAFLALLVRLFYFIPGELELPLQAMLLVIVAPYQSMNLRGTPPGAIISLVIAGYLAYQHFSRTGSLQKAFDQGSIIATLALICVVVSVPCLLLF